MGNLNDRLYEHVIAGEKWACDDMVTGNIGLVTSLVEQYLRRRPQHRYLRDDLISEGYYALVRAVRHMAEQDVRVKTPTRFIYVSVWRHIREACYLLSRYEMSFQAYQRATQLPVFEDRCPDTESPTEDLSECEEELAQCCQTEADEQIVELRKAGLKDNDIAIHVSLAPSVVHLKRTKIRERYERRSKAR